MRRSACRLCSLTTRSTRPSLPLRLLATFPSSPLSLSSVISPPSPSPLQRHTRAYAVQRGKALETVSCAAEPPSNPPEDFEPVEEELKEGEVLDMKLTQAAIDQIHRAQSFAKDPTLSLRLAVESGGCHGYSYKMMVTNKREPEDYRFPSPPPSTASLLIDAASLPLVKGSTIDYATELIGSSFRVVGNPQSKDAGCGCGVSWELKDIE